MPVELLFFKSPFLDRQVKYDTDKNVPEKSYNKKPSISLHNRVDNWEVPLFHGDFLKTQIQ